jgi:very-short-patch-repair endonuclease
LRKNLTESESILWSRLRRKQLDGVQFYRQKPIANYIVDFYAPRANLVIEVTDLSICRVITFNEIRKERNICQVWV